MTTPKMPKGDDPVAFGVRVTKVKHKEGFAVHTAGVHAESDYPEPERNPSRRQSKRPSIHNGQKGGNNA